MILILCVVLVVVLFWLAFKVLDLQAAVKQWEACSQEINASHERTVATLSEQAQRAETISFYAREDLADALQARNKAEDAVKDAVKGRRFWACQVDLHLKEIASLKAKLSRALDRPRAAGGRFAKRPPTGETDRS